MEKKKMYSKHTVISYAKYMGIAGNSASPVLLWHFGVKNIYISKQVKKLIEKETTDRPYNGV